MASAIDQLRWPTQALAPPASEQIRLFPSFVCIPDELALDFSQWFEVVSHSDDLSVEQRTALERLDQTLGAFSGTAHTDAWIEEALHPHPAWRKFRQRAIDVLVAFNWPREGPPSNGSIYVGTPHA